MTVQPPVDDEMAQQLLDHRNLKMLPVHAGYWLKQAMLVQGAFKLN